MEGTFLKQADGTWRTLGLRLAFFFLPLIVAWAAMERWACGVPNVYSVKRQRFEAAASKVDTLIMGASSAFHDIEPNLLSSGNVFNLGSPSESLYENEGMVERVLPQLPNLKRILIQIHYATLFDCRSYNWESWRQYCYQQEWRVPPMRLWDWLDCRMFSRLALRTPRFYLKLLTASAKNWLRTRKFECEPADINDIDNTGWQPLVNAFSPDSLGQAAVKHMIFVNHVLKPEYEPGNLIRLDHLVGMLRQRNVEVIFFATPVWRTFLEMQSQDCWKETERVLSQRTNNAGVFYYSFLDQPQFTAADFYDVDHLNSQGAVRFTKLLDSAINGKAQPSDAMKSLDSANRNK